MKVKCTIRNCDYNQEEEESGEKIRVCTRHELEIKGIYLTDMVGNTEVRPVCIWVLRQEK